MGGCAHFFPFAPEVLRLRALIDATRGERTAFGIDQADLDPTTTKKNPLLSVSKVIYLVLPLSVAAGTCHSGVGAASNALLQATRDTAAHDLVCQIFRSHFSVSGKNAFWLRCHAAHARGISHHVDHTGEDGQVDESADEPRSQAVGAGGGRMDINKRDKNNLLILPLETLKSNKFHFSNMHRQRLEFWRGKLERELELEAGDV